MVSLSAQPPSVGLGEPIQLLTSVSGGTPPYQYTYSGLPPPCTSTNASSLMCTPNQEGNFTVSVTVKDSAQVTATAETVASVTPPVREVVFTESGLPPQLVNTTLNRSWSLTVDGRLYSSNSTALSIEQPGGSHTYSVIGIDGYYATPAAGNYSVTIALAGAPYQFRVDFTPARLSSFVLFEMSSRPSGGEWTVAVGTIVQSSTGPTLGFWELNGSYSYSARWNGSGGPVVETGSVAIDGDSRVVSLNWESPSPPPGGPAYELDRVLSSPWTWIVSGAAALVVCLLVVGQRRRARQLGEEAGEAGRGPPPGGHASAVASDEEDPYDHLL